MALIDEKAKTNLQASLAAGVASISNDQKVSFQQYSKQVLSDDGSVFWVATGSAQPFTGSLHYMTDRRQDEDQTLAANRVIFTATEEVTELNAVNPSSMWVGTWTTGDGQELQIVFAERGLFYEQAGLWHYSGYAVYPALASQLVDSADDLPVGPIVSNSLPIWLTQNGMAPVYPSFLVPDNVQPPYIVAHITPETTDALGAFPILTWPTHPIEGLNPMAASQLMRDRVRLTLYGFTNHQAIQFLQSLIDYSMNTDAFGFMNSPAIRDEKRTQVEITALAMKKVIDITASYYQGTADAAARRLILSVLCSTTPIHFTSVTVN